jgi:(1->4)-alpha-D-glucan 1-alpha-D-glucosylmutase
MPASQQNRSADTPARVPICTYRLQFNRDFTFEQAAAILDYLSELGISDCYASPILEARTDSTHGYDICDFNALNSSLGGPEHFEHLASGIRKRGMGLLLDMVPNHMACNCGNAWWWDVLANGRESAFANYFDIDWDPTRADLRNKVLLPVLEDHYEKVLKAGKLKLLFEDGAFVIGYYQNRFPVSKESAAGLTGRAKPPAEPRPLIGRIRPTTGEIAEYNAAGNFEKLNALLNAQHYRLAYWRTGLAEVNYRRFFDVTDLVAVRMELPEVFEASHRLVFEMIGSGKVTGLRIDHPDGLWDPAAYFKRLKGRHSPGLFVVAEKILIGDEELPDDWSVDGTTGYDFLNRLNGIFVDEQNAARLNAVYHDFAGQRGDFPAVVLASKEAILATALQSDLNALTHRLQKLATRSRKGQDLTFESLRSALAAVIAAFPVYRTYVHEQTRELPGAQQSYIQHALDEARKLNLNSAALDFVESVLFLEVEQAREFVMRFQQLTSPLMAKGLEDTAFYRFNRLVSLNEVGGDPGRFGTTLAAFHQFNTRQAERWPHSLLATATHDTKRGEDARARINVLSEMPDEWASAVERWRDLNRTNKREIDGKPAPGSNDEYLFYQTVIGTWPFESGSEPWTLFRARIRDYMLKAAREAKVETSWLDPNAPYEEALRSFVQTLLEEGSPFVLDAANLQRRIAFFGRFNSLSQTVLKMTCPGIPDIYQGTELWDFSLVDPDNRRPVDYELRRKLLDEVKQLDRATLTGLLQDDPQGRLKMHLLRQLARLRHSERELFESGSYVPLAVSGAHRAHVCAFIRVLGTRIVTVIAPRLVCTLMRGEAKAPVGEVWGDTTVEIPTASLTNVLTNQKLATKGQLALRDALAILPFAVLRSD